MCCSAERARAERRAPTAVGAPPPLAPPPRPGVAGSVNPPPANQAARAAFAISLNSASSERVFALLASMFGEDQLSALADQVQASLMLAYNKRRDNWELFLETLIQLFSLLRFQVALYRQ